MKTMLFTGLALPLMLLLGACNSTAVKEELKPQPQPLAASADDSLYHLVFAQQNIPFFGLIDHRDTAKNAAGSMLYPGYSAGSFLAGVAVHAMLQGSANKKKKSARQEAANKVLQPYSDVIEQINPTRVFPETIEITGPKILRITPAKPALDLQHVYSVSVAPTFFITQNQRNLVLVNKVALSKPLPPAHRKPSKGKSNKKSLSPSGVTPDVKVEYLYSPNIPGKALDYWADEQYKAFIEAVQHMFSESLRLAFLKQRMQQAQNPVTTLRYKENGAKKVERGRLIESTPQRLTFVTLSGSIKSVPTLKRSL